MSKRLQFQVMFRVPCDPSRQSCHLAALVWNPALAPRVRSSGNWTASNIVQHPGNDSKLNVRAWLTLGILHPSHPQPINLPIVTHSKINPPGWTSLFLSHPTVCMLQDSSTMELNLPWKAKALERQTPPLGQVQFVQNTTILHSLEKFPSNKNWFRIFYWFVQLNPIISATSSNTNNFPLSPLLVLKSTSKSSLFPFVRPGCITWRSSTGYSLDLYVGIIWLYAEQWHSSPCFPEGWVAKRPKIKSWNYPKLFMKTPTGRNSIDGVHQKRWSFIQVAQPMRMSPARGWLRHQREADNSSPPLRLLNGHGKPGNRNPLNQIYISHSAVHDWCAEEGSAVLQ